jgi:hypothetical protein
MPKRNRRGDALARARGEPQHEGLEQAPADMWDWPEAPVPAADPRALAAGAVAGLSAQVGAWGVAAALGAPGLTLPLLSFGLGAGLGLWVAGRGRPWSGARARWLALRLAGVEAAAGAAAGALLDGPRAALALAGLGLVAGGLVATCAVGAAWHACDPAGAARAAGRPARWRRR